MKVGCECQYMQQIMKKDSEWAWFRDIERVLKGDNHRLFFKKETT